MICAVHNILTPGEHIRRQDAASDLESGISGDWGSIFNKGHTKCRLYYDNL